MRHTLFVILTVSLISVCHGQRDKERSKTETAGPAMGPYSDLITSEELKAALYFLASDYFEGRGTGSSGAEEAARYLAAFYAMQGIPAAQPVSSDDPLEAYLQHFPFETRGQEGVSQNVAAFIEGVDPVLKQEIIVVCAHYDHLGINATLEGDQIFNGAADDGSGTVALLEMAESFQFAKQQGHGPKRSILFLHFSAEEIGLQGSNYYTSIEPLIPLDRVQAVINLDGVGGWDVKNVTGPEAYVYVLQNDSTSAFLREKVNKLNTHPGLNLRLLAPSNPGNFRSDHQSFEYRLIPSIYFSTGLTEHYHKVSDEPATIDYDHMTRIVKLVFALSWDLSQSNAPLVQNFDRSAYSHTGHYYCLPCGCDKDQTLFDQPGLCPSCKMGLQPVWHKSTVSK